MKFSLTEYYDSLARKLLELDDGLLDAKNPAGETALSTASLKPGLVVLPFADECPGVFACVEI